MTNFDLLKQEPKFNSFADVKYDTDFMDEIFSTEWNESKLENDEFKNYMAKA